MEPLEEKLVSEEPPPLLGSWKRLYSAVLLYLGILIALLYILTQMFRA